MSATRTRLFAASTLALAFPLSALSLALTPSALAATIVIKDAGPTTVNILDDVNAFRAALGAPDNLNNAGPRPGGRREINWDGGGATNGTAPATPFTTFLNPPATRGILLTTPGTGLQQSLPGSGTFSLADINPSYATTFAPFSLNRVFTPVGSNITDATFFIPGTGTAIPAVISGFGAVFSDVDVANATTLEFFNPFGNSLGTFDVPAAPGTATFSFLGVIFDNQDIARVRINTGNSALSATATEGAGSAVDVVVMDDFLYAEPRAAIPVPASHSLLLLGIGLLALVGLRSRRVASAHGAQA
jgi:hypothetical protein